MAERPPMPLGSIVHIEIPAPDLKQAKAFYERLFGWQVEGSDESDYWMFSADEMSGGFDASSRPADQGVTLVIKVADINAKLAEIEAAGGKTVKPKTEIGGGYGFYAYFRDPLGNRLAVWSKT